MRIRMLCVGPLIFALAGCAHDATARQEPSAHGPRASAPTTSTPHSRVHHIPGCAARDLAVRFRPEGDGAGGHVIDLLDLTNVGGSRCLLSGYPRRVTLTEPGHRAVTATNGSFFPVEPSELMEPGGSTALGLETDAYCEARPTGGPSGPVYHEVEISLPGGVLTVTAPRGGLDVGCGVHLTRFGRWQ